MELTRDRIEWLRQCAKEDCIGDDKEVDALCDLALKAIGASSAEGAIPPGASVHDWPEDFPHNNGMYWCQCHSCAERFFGHKRRITCKVCATSAPAVGARKEGAELGADEPKTDYEVLPDGSCKF